VIPAASVPELSRVSHALAEIANIAPDTHQAYVGSSAFAHKAGLHASAIKVDPLLYNHVDPEVVGNGTRFVVSELAGRSTLELKARELGLDLGGAALGSVVDELKRLEHEGYHFEAADGSLELLLRRATGWEHDFFELESFRVITEERGGGRGFSVEATIKVHVGGERVVSVAEGNGPVNALDAALRSAIGRRYPSLSRLHLTDYKVRVLDTQKGTGAVTRVLIDSTDGERTWTTIGVSENIIEASWEALADSVVYGLLHAGDGG
jgi:2-isopropylmalate synthase